MTGKIMPLRERDTSTVQAAADAFLSSPRYANPNTRRGYADNAGHSSSRTTEVVYRRELRPVLTTGAEAMDRLFKTQASA